MLVLLHFLKRLHRLQSFCQKELAPYVGLQVYQTDKARPPEGNVGRLNEELASEAAARRRAEERQEQTERRLEQLQSKQVHSMMQRSMERHNIIPQSRQQQAPDTPSSGPETEPAKSHLQVRNGAHGVTVLLAFALCPKRSVE